LLTNRILDIVFTVVGIPFIPLQFITTFILGILVSLTFGLLLIPVSLIWILFFLGPLMGLSWLWLRLPVLRLPIAIVGIPLATIGHVFVTLMPSMGEWESRLSKMLLCETWPFTWLTMRWQMGKLDGTHESFHEELRQTIGRQTRSNPVMAWYVQALIQREATT
jgi:hypothetical protein